MREIAADLAAVTAFPSLVGRMRSQRHRGEAPHQRQKDENGSHVPSLQKRAKESGGDAVRQAKKSANVRRFPRYADGVILLLLALAPATALPGGPALLRSGGQDELVKTGDAHFAKRADGEAAKAVECYQKALALDDACVEAYWKIARAYFWLGPRDRNPEKLYRDGIEYAKRAVALDEDCIAAHFWLGVLYGLYGEAKGPLQSLHLVPSIRKEMEWVLKKDESFESGGPHRVLGLLEHKLLQGDRKKAIEHLLRAIELDPGLHDNHLFLAAVYLDEGRKADAKKELETVLGLPDHKVWGPESGASKARAKEMMKKCE